MVNIGLPLVLLFTAGLIKWYVRKLRYEKSTPS
jgi:hypothetical protein